MHLDGMVMEVCDRNILLRDRPVSLSQAESLLRGGMKLLAVLTDEQVRAVYALGETGKVAEVDLFETVEGVQTIGSVCQIFNRCTLLLVVHKKVPVGFLTHGMLIQHLAQRFAELKEHFLTVLDGSSEIIIVTDSRLNVHYLNKKAESFYNIKKDDAVGHDLKAFFSTIVLTDVLSSGVPVLESYHQPRPGLHVLINSLPVKVGSRLVGGVSLEQDITRMVNLNKEISKANIKLNVLQKEIDKIQNDEGKAFNGIYGHSPRLKEVVGLAAKVAATNAPVLLRGESGTGKELFAQAIHCAGERKEKPFVALNCGAIPQNLFESELFGYEGGAFTGADKKGKKGAFELAHGGTLFLDEIGEMQFELQVKLLRVLQENVFFRVGGAKQVKVDVRIVAATNKDLEKMVEEGLFRRDLYYRLNVVSMEIPPLRERKGDIPELVYQFIHEIALNHKKEIDDISAELMAAFLRYDWPGNVRELRNVIERLVILTEGRLINKDYLPPALLMKLDSKPAETEDVPLDKATRNVERSLILKALQDAQGNRRKAAELLGVPRSTLYYRMRKLGLWEKRKNFNP